MARVFSIFAGILTLAIAYRLTREIVAPIAAVVAVVLVASNTYFSWYVAFARVYPFSVCTAGAVIWLYYSVMFRSNPIKRIYFFALLASIYVFINLHYFNALLVLALGAYHLISVPKNKRWTEVTLTSVTAILLAMVYPIITFQGILFNITRKANPAGQLDGFSSVWRWLSMVTNDLPLLALLIGAGYVWALRRRKKVNWFPLIVTLLFAIGLALLASFSSLVTEGHMRYHLATLLPATGMMVGGLIVFPHSRKLLVLVAILWCIAGVKWQRSADWRQLIHDRYIVTGRPPTQSISSLALLAQPKPALIVYFDEYSYTHLLTFVGNNRQWEGYELSQAKHYFEQHDIDVLALADTFTLTPGEVDNGRGIWIVYRSPQLTEDAQAQIDSVTDALAYVACDTLFLPNDTIVVRHLWRPLNCQLSS